MSKHRTQRRGAATPETRRFHGRVYVEVPVDEMSAGDVVRYEDRGTRHARVVSVSGDFVRVGALYGMRTKRVAQRTIASCWRARTRLASKKSTCIRPPESEASCATPPMGDDELDYLAEYAASNEDSRSFKEGT